MDRRERAAGRGPSATVAETAPDERAPRDRTTRTTSRSRASCAARSSRRRWPAVGGAPDDELRRDPAEVAGFAAARAAVLRRIADACARAGRDPAGVTLVAVSKTVPRRAAAAPPSPPASTSSARTASRRRAAKIPLVPGARWHLVGPAPGEQGAAGASTLFDVIESRRFGRPGATPRPARRARSGRDGRLAGPPPGQRGRGPREGRLRARRRWRQRCRSSLRLPEPASSTAS